MRRKFTNRRTSMPAAIGALVFLVAIPVGGLVFGVHTRADAQAGVTEPSGTPVLVHLAKPNAETISTHAKWVYESLQKMRSIHPGMTRRDLEMVFARAGGLAPAMRNNHLFGIYSYRECPNFKVDVEFESAGKDTETKIAKSPSGMGSDLITSISRPYVDEAYSD